MPMRSVTWRLGYEVFARSCAKAGVPRPAGFGPAVLGEIEPDGPDADRLGPPMAVREVEHDASTGDRDGDLSALGGELPK